MYRHTSVIVVLLTFCGASADKLIDNFESGATKNLLSGDWYYFSDIKDGGNSVIRNAEMLSPGNYAAFKPDSGGYNASGGARLEYVLGNVMPVTDLVRGDKTGHCNFTGIGTNIARPGGIADIRPAYGISFRARSNDSILIFFEIVTSDIYDYAYYRAYFWVTDVWQVFKVDFKDTNQFMFPDNNYAVSDHPLTLSKVQKINWQVPKCFQDIGRGMSLTDVADYRCSKDTGCLYLDDIILLDSMTVATGRLPESLKRQPLVIPAGSNLLGQRSFFRKQGCRPAGLFVMPERKLLQIIDCAPVSASNQ